MDVDPVQTWDKASIILSRSPHESGVTVGSDGVFLRPAKRFCAIVSTRGPGARTVRFFARVLMSRTRPVRPKARRGIRGS